MALAELRQPFDGAESRLNLEHKRCKLAKRCASQHRHLEPFHIDLGERDLAIAYVIRKRDDGDALGRKAGLVPEQSRVHRVPLADRQERRRSFRAQRLGMDGDLLEIPDRAAQSRERRRRRLERKDAPGRPDDRGQERGVDADVGSRVDDGVAGPDEPLDDRPLGPLEASVIQGGFGHLPGLARTDLDGDALRRTPCARAWQRPYAVGDPPQHWRSDKPPSGRSVEGAMDNRRRSDEAGIAHAPGHATTLNRARASRGGARRRARARREQAQTGTPRRRSRRGPRTSTPRRVHPASHRAACRVPT
jgi:hypothetical protein